MISTGNEVGDLTARRLAYRQARKEARRARTYALGSSVAVDDEDLLSRGGSCDSSSLSRLIHRRLCARALAAEGFSAEQMARAWSMPVDAVRELVAAPLVDPERAMDKTDAELRAQFNVLDLE